MKGIGRTNNAEVTQQQQQQQGFLIPSKKEDNPLSSSRRVEVGEEEEEYATARKVMEEEEEEEEEEDEEEEEEEDEVVDEDDNEDEEEGEEEEEEEEDRPKLDEGFYEIQDIRKRRVCKGQVQYLIKWRGWPESANTWEPVDNLQTCVDIIEAFENRTKSGKSHRKRKRKYTSSSQAKKHYQQQQRSTSLEAIPFPCATTSQYPHINRDVAQGKTAACENYRDVELNHHSSNDNASLNEHPTRVVLTNVLLDEHPSGDVSPITPLTNSNKEVNEGDPNFSVQIPATACFSDEQGIIVIDGHRLPSTEHAEPVQTNRFTGAKKRKAGCVRRFTQDPLSLQLDAETQNPTSTNDFGEKNELHRVQTIGSTGDTDHKNNLDESRKPILITKIIKPIGFSASISDTEQDVLVTFQALRSDGSEVYVDNKTLKASNPHLLISFYEQHLRYSSPL